MFDMEKIGQKISMLRKAQNMTQMELADRMNISFQAVSNWERGLSMPDISKLPELAQLFGVTIDELLGEKSEILESIVNDNTDEFLKNNIVEAEEFIKIAPILKPLQADELLMEVNLSLKLSEIADIIPFISRDLLNQIVLKAADKQDYQNLDDLAPFIDEDIINGIAHKMVSEGKSIEEIAPFISKKHISEFALIFYEKGGLSALDQIAPFIPKDTLIEIAENEYINHGLKDFEFIAPFINKEYLNQLAKRVIQEEGINAIIPIAPFLDRKMLTEYIKEKIL